MVALLAGLLAVAVVALVALELKRSRLSTKLRETQDLAQSAATSLQETQRQVHALALKLKESQRQFEETGTKLSEAEFRCQRLSKFQVVVDAEDTARSILENANSQTASIIAIAKREADSVVADAQITVQRMIVEAISQRSKAEVEIEEVRNRSLLLMEEARSNAARIEAAAKQRAEEIALGAKEAIETAAKLEQTAQAMKNVIEGYGDQYVVPTYGLLDELAEHFGFTEAGQALKGARSKVREMIALGRAATCDYVEKNRRGTAIDFVLDAFNGKVDSVLADVRDDNYGTLARKIQDAFSLVNMNGEAFRNARITEEYLAARLEELRWAVIAQELKLKEKEEQRALKERIREEEKAQREFERAMREAEKEEDLLRKAMDKARAEVEKASDAQKAKYESQLALLAGKLREAEEKNQRALSMAQQTRTGHVYIISNVGSFGEKVHKIGLTRRLEPLDRIRELGDASVPFEFDVHALIPSEDAPALEKQLHKVFLRTQVNKVNPRKEFFRVSLAEIRAAVDDFGCKATWTMTAKCSEYKESLAIEKGLRDKTMSIAEWETSQLREHEESSTRQEEATG